MSNLLRLIGRRLIALPIMIIGVTLLVFFLMALSPIDQAYSALGENASQEAVEQYRETHGLNDPIIVQYGNYMVGLVQGDLGTYGAGSTSVAERVATSLPITLQLTFLGLVIAVVVAVPLGVISALYRDRWPDQIIRVISIVCVATPSFWLAVLLILLFFVNLHWLPAAGPLPAFGEDPVGWIRRMAMPAIALAVPVIGQFTRIIRTAMVEELDTRLRAYRPRLVSRWASSSPATCCATPSSPRSPSSACASATSSAAPWSSRSSSTCRAWAWRS